MVEREDISRRAACVSRRLFSGDTVDIDDATDGLLKGPERCGIGVGCADAGVTKLKIKRERERERAIYLFVPSRNKNVPLLCLPKRFHHAIRGDGRLRENFSAFLQSTKQRSGSPQIKGTTARRAYCKYLIFARFQEKLLLVSKVLPIFGTWYYFCACSDLSLLYEAYDFSSQSEV